jgi:hypothetical protein
MTRSDVFITRADRTTSTPAIYKAHHGAHFHDFLLLFAQTAHSRPGGKQLAMGQDECPG